MKCRKRTILATTALGLTAAVMTAAPASAADGSVQGQLTPVPVNGVDGSGQAMIEIDGTTLTFTLAAEGLLAGAPHAAHIHYGEDSANRCPTEAENTAEALQGETDPSAHLTTTETGAAYGPIVVSLTTSGDTSPDSGLAVDRFSSDGQFEYSRADVQVTEEVAEDILSGESAVVVHGVDYDGDGTYSAGQRGVSDLDPSLPGEATDPAICGVLSASQMGGGMPEGGVDTGAGSTSGTEHLGLIGAGALAAAGGVYLVTRRRPRADQV